MMAFVIRVVPPVPPVVTAAIVQPFANDVSCGKLYVIVEPPGHGSIMFGAVVPTVTLLAVLFHSFTKAVADALDVLSMWTWARSVAPEFS